MAHPGMATRALGHMSAVKMAAGGQRQWRKFSRRSRLLHITALAARRKIDTKRPVWRFPPSAGKLVRWLAGCCERSGVGGGGGKERKTDGRRGRVDGEGERRREGGRVFVWRCARLLASR